MHTASVRTPKKNARIQSTGEKSRKKAARRDRSGTATEVPGATFGLLEAVFLTIPSVARARTLTGGRVPDALGLCGSRAV
jgi:hypothetical protein